jgi:hypothetical protein
MTTLRTAATPRNIVAAVLAGGLLTSLSACGGNTTAATSVSEAQPIQGSPLVACGMAQLSPRVPDGDAVLGRAQTFFAQLEQAQSVPPAVQNVYNSDVSALNPDQQHEVLLMLSSLNECPDVSPQLQQSVLAAFDQLAPQTVADPSVDPAAAPSSSDGQTVVIRADNTTVQDAASDQMIWDGSWNGHPWWFRPTWDHPVTDTADWAQWGNDRRAGIVWRWHDNGWQRIGRPDSDPPSRPWLPTVIGQGRLNHDPGAAGGRTQVQMPGQSPLPQVPAPQVTASAQPNVNAPIARPDFRDSQPGNDVPGTRPDDTTGRPGTMPATTAPTPSSDQQPTGTAGESSTNRDTNRSDTATTRSTHTDSGTASTASPAPTPRPDTTTQTRDRGNDSTRGSDAGGVSGGVTTRSDERRHDPNAG